MGSYIFEPPLAPLNPPYLPDSDAMQVGLWRHYRPRIVGVNVYLLNDGDYVQTTATPTLVTPLENYKRTGESVPLLAMTNVAACFTSGPQPPWEPSTAMTTVSVPYPWNPTTPNVPYVHITNWTGSVTTVTLTPRIEEVWYGGHTNTITETVATALVKAGYATCIREAP